MEVRMGIGLTMTGNGWQRNTEERRGTDKDTKKMESRK
jgi:hypothetical protein